MHIVLLNVHVWLWRLILFSISHSRFHRSIDSECSQSSKMDKLWTNKKPIRIGRSRWRNCQFDLIGDGDATRKVRCTLSSPSGRIAEDTESKGRADGNMRCGVVPVIRKRGAAPPATLPSSDSLATRIRLEPKRRHEIAWRGAIIQAARSKTILRFPGSPRRRGAVYRNRFLSLGVARNQPVVVARQNSPFVIVALYRQLVTREMAVNVIWQIRVMW